MSNVCQVFNDIGDTVWESLVCAVGDFYRFPDDVARFQYRRGTTF
jgi:hypothetical protein